MKKLQKDWYATSPFDTDLVLSVQSVCLTEVLGMHYGNKHLGAELEELAYLVSWRKFRGAKESRVNKHLQKRNM